MKLTLTEGALDDLRSIRAYTLETWGDAQEKIYLQKIWNRLHRLQDDPSRHRLREDLFPGCRIAAEGRHVILFRSEGDAISIVRILHSAMDFKRHFPDM